MDKEEKKKYKTTLRCYHCNNTSIVYSDDEVKGCPLCLLEDNILVLELVIRD